MSDFTSFVTRAVGWVLMLSPVVYLLVYGQTDKIETVMILWVPFVLGVMMAFSEVKVA